MPEDDTNTSESPSTETAAGTANPDTGASNEPGAAENTEGTATEGTKSRLKQVLANLKSDAFSTSVGSLIDIWKDKGLTEEEIEKLLKEFQKSEKKRLAEKKTLLKEAKAIDAKLEENANSIAQAKLVVATLETQIATLNGRIAERQLVLEDLDEQLQESLDKSDKVQVEIDRLKKELGLQ